MSADDAWLDEVLDGWIGDLEALWRRLDPDRRDYPQIVHEELRPYAAEVRRRLMALDLTRLRNDPRLTLRDVVYLAQAVDDARAAQLRLLVSMITRHWIRSHNGPQYRRWPVMGLHGG